MPERDAKEWRRRRADGRRLLKLFSEIDPAVYKILTFSENGDIVLWKREARGSPRFGLWIIEGDMPPRMVKYRHKSAIPKRARLNYR